MICILSFANIIAIIVENITLETSKSFVTNLPKDFFFLCNAYAFSKARASNIFLVYIILFPGLLRSFLFIKRHGRLSKAQKGPTVSL